MWQIGCPRNTVDNNQMINAGYKYIMIINQDADYKKLLLHFNWQKYDVTQLKSFDQACTSTIHNTQFQTSCHSTNRKS
jgi:hypothetical protein